jgi:hypothetical protein
VQERKTCLGLVARRTQKPQSLHTPMSLLSASDHLLRNFATSTCGPQSSKDVLVCVGDSILDRPAEIALAGLHDYLNPSWDPALVEP